MKETAASEAQKPPKGHPYVQGFREFQFLDELSEQPGPPHRCAR
jgi:hypothetical protein